MKTNSHKLPKVLNSFSYYLLCVKCYSENTVKSYISDILIFIKFIIEYLDLNIDICNISPFILLQIKKSDIYAFISYMNYEMNNGPYTRKRRVIALKQFYNYLLDKYSTTNRKVNPTIDIRQCGEIIRLPKYLNLEQAKKIQNIFNYTNCKNPERDNLILILLLNTGMRVGELANLNLRNINLEEKTINVIGKGNKERIIYINEYCKNGIKNYLTLRKKSFKPFLVTKKGERLTVNRIESICKKAFKLMDLEEYNYTTHSLRHTAATIIYKSCNDILITKEFLGHSSIVSTQIYTHINNRELKRAMERHPLNC